MDTALQTRETAEPTDLVAALAGASTRRAFVDACRRIVQADDLVRLNPERLDALVPMVADATPVPWTWYVRENPETLEQAAFDLVAMSAPNGGYFHTDATGAVVQWAHEGSGAKMLARWTRGLAERGLLPGVDIHDPAVARAAIAPHLAGVPYAGERLEIAAELACPARRRRFRQLFDACREADGSWRLTLEVADHLAAIYPAGFAEDPFRKKAILALIMLHGYLHHAGETVSCETPLPADYQMPRIFHYTGCLTLAPGLSATLRAGDRLLDAESPAVTALRAAAVVLADTLAQATGQPDSVVDGALFLPFRKDAGFQRDSLPAMRCATMWF